MISMCFSIVWFHECVIIRAKAFHINILMNRFDGFHQIIFLSTFRCAADDRDSNMYNSFLYQSHSRISNLQVTIALFAIMVEIFLYVMTHSVVDLIVPPVLTDCVVQRYYRKSRCQTHGFVSFAVIQGNQETCHEDKTGR